MLEKERKLPVSNVKLGLIFSSLVGIAALVGMAAHHGESLNARPPVPPQPYFPLGAIWTRDISNASVDPNSGKIISWLANNGGWGRGKMQIDFTLRVLQVAEKTSYVPFRPSSRWMDSDSDAVSQVPLPEGGGMEGRPGYKCSVEEEDCHFIAADRSHGRLYEAWKATYTNGGITADMLTVWDLNRVYPPSGRGDQCTSADAAGFPIAPLLFNADELAYGSINHAIRFILPNARIREGVYVHPATHAGSPGGPELAPPYGALFRLKRAYDVSKLSPPAQVVARAMQTYGMYLSDGGNIALTAQSDQDTVAKYADLNFGPHELGALKVTDFEVLDLGPPIPLTYGCARNP